jgi:hypothetical protein
MKFADGTRLIGAQACSPPRYAINTVARINSQNHGSIGSKIGRADDLKRVFK